MKKRTSPKKSAAAPAKKKPAEIKTAKPKPSDKLSPADTPPPDLPAAPGPQTPPVEPEDTGKFKRIVLKPHEDRRVRRGHLWVFSNEVQSLPADVGAGDPVHFYTAHKEFLGVGFYNPHSLIAGRLLDRHAVEPDAPFFEKRLRNALDLRRSLYSGDAYRWVFGESDDLPGLVIDRYGDACVIESYCAGMDKLMPVILEAVNAIHPWKTVVLKNDVDARRYEKLSMEVKLVRGQADGPHWFEMDGLKIAADLTGGQKTGFFLDHRDNRAVVAAFGKGKRVLDVFCHTGAFGLWAAQAGAASVTGVDDAEPALNLAREIADANALGERMNFVKANAFEWLPSSKEKFDIIVLDPPKMAASKKNLPAAIQAYARLNAAALRRVSGGGFLATASCSQHVEKDTFRQILSRAAYESGRRVRQIFWGGQAKDHPVRLSMPETDYLKFAILSVS